jgi:hypothetical protein
MTQTVNETAKGALAAAPGQAGTAPAPQSADEIAARRRALRMAWLWFGPLAVVEALRLSLKTRMDALPTIAPITAAPYVETFAGHDDAALHALMWKASQPLLIGVVALAVVIFIAWRVVHRWGWRRAGIAATWLWCVLCAGTVLGLAAHYVNRVDLTPLPPVAATVISALPYPTSESGPGGALTWLQPPGTASADGVPWRIKIEGADFQAMPVGLRVTLQRARGAFWGTYLTGSDAPQALPWQDVAPSPKPNPASRQTQPADPS